MRTEIVILVKVIEILLMSLPLNVTILLMQLPFSLTMVYLGNGWHGPCHGCHWQRVPIANQANKKSINLLKLINIIEVIEKLIETY